MRIVITAAALAVAALAGAASAQDATDTDLLFTEWQVAYQAWIEARDAEQPNAAELALASEAAAAAYEEALMADNVALLAENGAQPMTDEIISLLEAHYTE
ncbi:hypothetical protein HKCCE2091_12695 [Rhodobacterales bacterium HKCCE2091]|nr:hypothetical protein [Rhodobacterales bacterium HKCCE2091]